MALPEYPLIDIEDYLLLDRHSQDRRYEYLINDMYRGMKLTGTCDIKNRKD